MPRSYANLAVTACLKACENLRRLEKNKILLPKEVFNELRLSANKLKTLAPELMWARHANE
jgi:IS4 transposase